MLYCGARDAAARQNGAELTAAIMEIMPTQLEDFLVIKASYFHTFYGLAFSPGLLAL